MGELGFLFWGLLEPGSEPLKMRGADPWSSQRSSWKTPFSPWRCTEGEGEVTAGRKLSDSEELEGRGCLSWRSFHPLQAWSPGRRVLLLQRAWDSVSLVPVTPQIEPRSCHAITFQGHTWPTLVGGESRQGPSELAWTWSLQDSRAEVSPAGPGGLAVDGAAWGRALPSSFLCV